MTFTCKRTVLTRGVLAVVVLCALSLQAKTPTDAQRQAFRENHAKLQQLSRMCIDECIKNVGPSYSHTSSAGRRCRSGHDKVNKGLMLWMKGQGARNRGDMQAYAKYDNEAKVYIVSGGSVCPRLKEKLVQALLQLSR